MRNNIVLTVTSEKKPQSSYIPEIKINFLPRNKHIKMPGKKKKTHIKCQSAEPKRSETVVPLIFLIKKKNQSSTNLHVQE